MQNFLLASPCRSYSRRDVTASLFSLMLMVLFLPYFFHEIPFYDSLLVSVAFGELPTEIVHQSVRHVAQYIKHNNFPTTIFNYAL